MSEDDQAMLAMWDARMSTASIAAVLGRKESDVEKRLLSLRDERRAAAAPRPAAPTIPQPATPAPPPPPPPASPPPASSSRRPRHLYRPVSPATLRYARWFRDAAWSLREIAWLFGVEVEDLKEALGV